MNTFKFVGKIKKLEDKKDRKNIETVNFDSGWTIERVKFRMACGDCSMFVDLSGGKRQDDSKNVVYTSFQKEGGESKMDVEKATVNWKDRFDPAIIEKVPRYKRYTVDLASDKIREELEAAKKPEEAAALAQLKYTYISNYDFALKVEELLKLNKFGDDNYVVTGFVEYNYSNKDSDSGKYYKNFVPTSIHKASEDDVVGCFGRTDFYYVKDTVLGDPLENGDVPLIGYTQFYDRMSKENFFAPLVITIKSNNEKKDALVTMFKKFGDDDAEVLLLGVNVEYYSGAEKTNITEDDFTDDQKEFIRMGLMTVEEVKRDMGGSAYGDKVNYVYFNGIARGYTKGPQNPEVEGARLEARPDGKKKDSKFTVSKGAAFNLFDKDEDDDDII